MVPPPQRIVEWVNRTYPKPKVDPEWLEECYEYVVKQENLDPVTDFDSITKQIEKQLLGSSLSDSTLPGTGFPRGMLTAKDFQLPKSPPILVEIVLMTDIGVSAYNLMQVRQARIDGADLVGLSDDEDDGEGRRRPKYPRSMLRLDISDGSTTIRAMEYRRLPQLELGETPLGYKMLIKDATVTNGWVRLQPSCVVMKEGSHSDLAERQDEIFLNDLRRRLKQDGGADGPTGGGAQAPPPPPDPDPPAAHMRSPPHGRNPADPSAPGPSRASYLDDDDEPPRHNVAAPQRHHTPPTESRYFAQPAAPPPAEFARTRMLSPRRTADPTLLAESPTPAGGGGADDTSSEFGMLDDFDDAALELIDFIEKEAVTRSQEQARGHSSGVVTANRSRQAVTNARDTAPLPEIEDDTPIVITDEEDQENIPVPTRRVPRRTAPPVRDIEVISISDSD